MRTKKVLLAALIIAAVAAAGVLLWLNGSFLPGWVTWNHTAETLDLDTDGTDEKLVLQKKKVYIMQGDDVCWSSPFSWRISDVFARDLEGDGIQEIILLVWKHGSYGPNRPFWVEKDTITFSQHVFIFRFREGKVSSVWMSSDIGRKITGAFYDEKTFLHLIDINGEETVWAWDNWGLVLVEENEEEAIAAAESTVEIQEPETTEAATASKPNEQTKATGDIEDSKTAETMEESAVSEASTAESAEKTEASEAVDTDAEDRKSSSDPDRIIIKPGLRTKTSRVTMIAVGDNLAHTGVNEESYDPEKGYFDYSPIYTEVSEKISAYDLAVVNQETVLISDPALRSGYPMFATPNTMGDALAEAGFDIVLAATNHSYDAGTRGIEDTVKFWKKKYPKIFLLGMFREKDAKKGRDKYYVNHIEKNGIRLALFNFTEMTNGLVLPEDYKGGVNTLQDRDKLIHFLRKAESTDDFSICFLHIGEEYTDGPSEAQRQFTKELIDAGADLIICSHPHVLQGYEKLTTDNGAEGVVYWSLGNFMSHQTYADTELGGAASIEIEKTTGKKAKLVCWELFPTVCHFDGQMTKVYFLEDYTDNLAAAHQINWISETVSVKGLWEKYKQRCGGQS